METYDLENAVVCVTTKDNEKGFEFTLSDYYDYKDFFEDVKDKFNDKEGTKLIIRVFGLI